MSVLIIGASLIGSQVARVLVEDNLRPVLFDVDFQQSALNDIIDLDQVDLVRGSVLRRQDLTEAIHKYHISEIVHLAANAMLTKGAQENPYSAIELNILGTANVLEVAREQGLRRVVAASSSALAEFLSGGEDEGAMEKEEAFPRPTTFYAATKQAKESLGLNYANWCGVDFVALRFASVAGPWRGKGGGGAPSTAFRVAIDNAIAGRPATVPARTLEWLYVKDAARAVQLVLNAEKLHSRVFNVGMGKIYTPEEIVSEVLKIMPRAPITVEQLPAGTPDTLPIPPLSLDRIRRELAYEPEFDMATAIHDYACWAKGLDRK